MSKIPGRKSLSIQNLDEDRLAKAQANARKYGLTLTEQLRELIEILAEEPDPKGIDYGWEMNNDIDSINYVLIKRHKEMYNVELNDWTGQHPKENKPKKA